MKKKPDLFCEHILESIQDIELYVSRLSKEDFFKDRKTQDAVVRRLEIIGEAVKNISSSIKKKYPDIRWKGIAGMRDIIVHEYFGVNLKVVWRTVVHDLPVLKGRIASLLEDLVKNQKLL